MYIIKFNSKICSLASHFLHELLTQTVGKHVLCDMQRNRMCIIVWVYYINNNTLY